MRFVLSENEFAKLDLEVRGDIGLIHCTVYKWSKDLYKEYLVYWNKYIIPKLKGLGIEELWATFETKEGKPISKFAKMFGFQEFAKVDDDGVSHDIMVLEV